MESNTSVEIEQLENVVEMEEDDAPIIKEDENLEHIVQKIQEEETEDIKDEDKEEIGDIEEDISNMNMNTEEDISNVNTEENIADTDKNEDKKLKNEENAFIISGYKSGITVFLEISDIENNSATWTKNLLEAKIYLEDDLEKLLFLLKSLYFETDEIANIDIRKFHWEKHNSLNKYFSDLENRLETIKSKMTAEEYEFLLKYKDKL